MKNVLAISFVEDSKAYEALSSLKQLDDEQSLIVLSARRACEVPGPSSPVYIPTRSPGGYGQHGPGPGAAAVTSYRPNWPETDSLATIHQNRPQIAGSARDADRVDGRPFRLQSGHSGAKGALTSHARDRCGLLATQRPLDAVRQPPDRPHRSLRVEPLRGVNLLPTLDRRRVGDSGPAAAPEPAIHALREVAKRHSGGRDVPHIFPAPARRGRAHEADLPS